MDNLTMALQFGVFLLIPIALGIVAFLVVWKLRARLFARLSPKAAAEISLGLALVSLFVFLVFFA